MQPPFSFPEIIQEELLRDDRSIYFEIGNDIEDSLTREQFDGLRISDVGTCSLSLWAKVNGEYTLPKIPQEQWSRLMAGSMFGALIGRIFKAGLQHRGITCNLEETIAFEGIPGHADIILPDYQHLYELKSNYNSSVKGPSKGHWQQAAMYATALGEEYTVSIVMIQPTITGDRPRLMEYAQEIADLAALARSESFRLRKAAGAIVPPEPDISADETWRCKSCQYAGCAKNVHPFKNVRVEV